MRFIADFHIHSHFSLATSRNLTPEHLDYWAGLKGINVIGTGDAVHPGWLAELKEKLIPAENGLFRLKEEYRLAQARALFRDPRFSEPYFILTGEVSSIYKKNGRVRKVHSVCVFPDFASTERMQARLEKIGNIRSDGRPILGLDAKVLLGMMLDISDSSFVIPAHIWTPWFSVLGSKSGFDSMEECYDDLTPMIHAVETGLSSDPAMNWTCSFLDRYRLVSNSDAHSPEKLGREANIFDTELGYRGIVAALESGEGFTGTAEFYPQEGKYHHDGHRKCGVRWDPLETLRHRGICPVCGKPVTLGVLYRVAELADRSDINQAPCRKEFHSITQLDDILAEIRGVKNSGSPKIRQEYLRIIDLLGPEFSILLERDIPDIAGRGSEILAEAVRRLREGEIHVDEGYDGEFGRIRVFAPEEADAFSGRNLFSIPDPEKGGSLLHESGGKTYSVKFDIARFKELKSQEEPAPEKPAPKPEPAAGVLSPEQERGVRFYRENCLITAGPGSGKTRMLTERISYLVKTKGEDPASILAITFSNRAAEEIAARIRVMTGITGVTVSTIHSLGLQVLKYHCRRFHRETGFVIIDDDDKREILASLGMERKKIDATIHSISSWKNGITSSHEPGETARRYDNALREINAFDLDDLLHLPLALFREDPRVLDEMSSRYRWIMVDEFQDINGSQYDLIRLLADGDRNILFAIGDPDQSIYGFRGSDERFMERLKSDYPGLRELKLTRSFRCPDRILKTGGHVIGREDMPHGTGRGLRVRIAGMETDRSEADWIAATIEGMMGGVRSFSMESGMSDGTADDSAAGFSDFAILCRASFMFEPLTEALGNHGIACQVIDTKPFYRREPLSSYIALLKRHQGPASLRKDADPGLAEMLAASEPLAKIFEKMLGKGIPGVTPPALHEQESLMLLAEKYGSRYGDFFRALAMNQGSDDFRPSLEAVSLMTLHASKGLEFRTVFIPGCEEGIIPFELFEKLDDRKILEERRLLYVGITRSLNNLILTHAGSRRYRGRIMKNERSRFLDDIEKDLVDYASRKPGGRKNDGGQLDLFGSR